MVEEPKIFDRAHHGYQHWIAKVLDAGRRRAMIVIASLAILVAAGVSAAWLGTEFLPELDEGDAYVLVQMPASISLEKGQEVLRDVRLRSEERRVGKECRSRWSPYH